jgi:hypothetical protein
VEQRNPIIRSRHAGVPKSAAISSKPEATQAQVRGDLPASWTEIPSAVNKKTWKLKKNLQYETNSAG